MATCGANMPLTQEVERGTQDMRCLKFDEIYKEDAVKTNTPGTILWGIM